MNEDIIGKIDVRLRRLEDDLDKLKKAIVNLSSIIIKMNTLMYQSNNPTEGEMNEN